jgi:hypothetical protein
VLSLSTDDHAIFANVIVWDFVGSEVLLLSNSHIWDSPEYKYCFPPPGTKSTKRKRRRKSATEGDDVENEELTLKNLNGFSYTFVLTSELFVAWDKGNDFAVFKLPGVEFRMERIPISIHVSLTLKIHAFGYVGHTQHFNVTSGEVCSIGSEGGVSTFAMNLLSAPGFSGAAILADNLGRVVGYMGGNCDCSSDKNSQHQSYGHSFEAVIKATNRQDSPNSSPEKEVSSSASVSTH